MPTYQYACRSCNHRFDVVQGFDESALTTCPACGEEQLRKLFGNVGVVFKGSGFYRNDSRSGKAKTTSGSTKPSDAGSSTSTTTDAPKSSSGKSDTGSSAAKSSSTASSAG
jgi:putative FmdB family regulatory protein